MAEQQLPAIDNDKIKEMEEKDALTRIETIKKLVPKSVNDTLRELKLSKYKSNITTNFSISEQEVINKLKTEWDNYFAENNTNDSNNISEYLTANKCYVWHSFWDLILNSMCNYCETISKEIFPNSSKVQLCNTLNKCLCVCTLCDIFQCKITISDTNKKKLLSQRTAINNINLQNIINKNIGTKLDIEKWKQQNGAEDKKIYKQYGTCLQKEAVKSGKGFVKLYKIYKLKQVNEKKKLKEQQQKEKEFKETKEKPKEEAKEVIKEEIKEELKEERKEEAKEEIKEEIKQFKEEIKQEENVSVNSNNITEEQSNSNMKYIIILAVIGIVIAIMFQMFGKK